MPVRSAKTRSACMNSFDFDETDKHTVALPRERVVDSTFAFRWAGSHDSGPILSSGDIAVAYEYVLKLDQLFFCSKCHKYVSVDAYVDHGEEGFLRMWECAFGVERLMLPCWI
jgi:hypothetical protein